MTGKTITHAVVRGVPRTFDSCIRPEGNADPIDVVKARVQHDAYCAVLERLGLGLIRVEADERYPDCCFVEDPVIVVGNRVIFGDMAAPARRGEHEAVLRAIERCKEACLLSPPATMDGGDVMRAGERMFVGISRRTNREAARQLGELLAVDGIETTVVEVKDILHLKSACTALDGDTIVFAPGFVDRGAFANYRVLEVPEEEHYAANCVSVNGTVIVSDGYPETRSKIEAAGFETVALEMSEFRKGGGSLTCLSILF